MRVKIDIMTKKILLFLLVITLFFPGIISGQDLISVEFIGDLSKFEMQLFYGQFMQNGVERYKITYTTPDVHGVLDTASGLVVIPIRDEPMNYPLLCYQHGTVDGPEDVPSNIRGGAALATIWGGLGYIVGAADYLGLGEARGFHPYIHAVTEASAAVDMLFATRQFVEENGFHLNDQLFITGYSQGGHAAMAVQRSIQQNYAEDFTITAAAPMSGAYDISTAMVDLAQSEEPYYYLGYLAYTVQSMNISYNLGYETEDIFKAPYVDDINAFYSHEIGVSDLHAALTAKIQDIENAAPIPKFIFQDTFLTNITNNPNHPMITALKDNDVYNWAPSAPTRLYYCMADDQVPFRNSIIADSVMNENGAIDVEAIDVDAEANHTGCVVPAITNATFFFLQYQSITTNVKNPVAEAQTPEFYPNPGHGILYAYAKTAMLFDIEIYSISGQRLYRKNKVSTGEKIDISHLGKGIYFLRWKNKGYSGVKRIVLE